jgi:O-phosphoseryl-tRNA(Cys) synthetase
MLNINFPIFELVDRYVIAQVKYERTQRANVLELEFYERQMQQIDQLLIKEELEQLKELHNNIWNLEDDFKKCRIDGTDLVEIGRRALEIRDYNNKRVMFKNLIAEKLNDPIREIKQ